MPCLKRPDGVELHWEETGEGPLVVLTTQFFAYPEVFEDLIADLSRDHRVVTYDARGAGRSTRRGPYEIDTDADDLRALIEQAGGPALVIGMGDGTNRAVKVAARRPDLVTAIATPGGNPVGRLAARGTDALVDSPSVLEALVGMIETDYRAALRTMIAGASPQMSDEQARERVDRVVSYCPREVGASRLRSWIADESLEPARTVGDRLWILELEGENPWFSADAVTRTRELLPDAHVERIERGVLTRPDLTTSFVRRITSPERVTEISAGREKPL